MSTPVVLEWRNLNLTIQKKEFSYLKCRTTISEEKQILDNVSGNVQSGQLMAILGASGAGKTTLLAGISQRFRGPLKGQISINGSPVDRKTMTKMSCFVPQFDITLNSLTPNEHMYFMSQLKLDRKWSRSRKNQRIVLLLREMGLQNVANNRIFTLSGSERKKLNLATDLLTNPPIIFCDEPTTGLDSYNAYSVVKALKYLTNSDQRIDTLDSSIIDSVNGIELKSTLSTNELNRMPMKAIICSIHQPTSEIFQYFSHIVLMYSGRCVFHGAAADALTHFSRLGFKCPIEYNPPDFYLKVLSTSIECDEDKKSFFKNPIKLVRKSFDYKPVQLSSSGESSQLANVSVPKIHSTFWIQQVWLLLMRSLLEMSRNYREIFIELLIFLIPYIAMAFLYTKSTGRTQNSIQDVQGLIVLTTTELIFTNSYSSIHYYSTQMPILRRETNENIYHFSAYYLSEILSLMPITFVRAIIGLSIIFIGTDFGRSYQMFIQLGSILFTSGLTASAYGLFIFGVFRTGTLEMAGVFDLIFLSLTGFYINLDAFPYLRYISLFYFSNEALAISYWHNITTIECSPVYERPCLKNGIEVLQSKSYHLTYNFLYWDYVGLITLAIVMHSIAFIGIRRTIRRVGYY